MNGGEEGRKEELDESKFLRQNEKKKNKQESSGHADPVSPPVKFSHASLG